MAFRLKWQKKKTNNCSSTSLQETFSTYYVIHYYLGYNREKNGPIPENPNPSIVINNYITIDIYSE